MQTGHCHACICSASLESSSWRHFFALHSFLHDSYSIFYLVIQVVHTSKCEMYVINGWNFTNGYEQLKLFFFLVLEESPRAVKWWLLFSEHVSNIFGNAFNRNCELNWIVLSVINDYLLKNKKLLLFFFSVRYKWNWLHDQRIKSKKKKKMNSQSIQQKNLYRIWCWKMTSIFFL